MSTEILADLSEQVRSAAADNRPILIRGGNTKAFYGNPFVPNGVASVMLDMRCLKGIVNYQPSELVVTALAGTPLQEVIDTLDASDACSLVAERTGLLEPGDLAIVLVGETISVEVVMEPMEWEGDEAERKP